MNDLLVDANSLWARSYYAVANKPVFDPAEAVRIALTTFLRVLDTHSNGIGQVHRLLFAWDGAKKRDKGRDPKPPSYYETREYFKEAADVLFAPEHAQLEDYEADDVLATAATQSTAKKVYILSGDKDLHQMHGQDVHYYCLNSKGLLAQRYINMKWGVKHPSQVAIALAIMGDKVDNIPGLRGWGPAKVKHLFKRVDPRWNFGEALQTIVEQIPENLHEAFYASLDLTLLNTELPGVPQAAPLILADMSAAEALEWPTFISAYRPIYAQYSRRTRSVEAYPTGTDDAAY